jgi:HAD superfamily hydrolase (TIGR01509 family)
VAPALVLLDFDGLICDTEQAARQSWQDLYAGYGFRFPAEVWHRMIGRSGGEAVAVADLAGRLGRPPLPERLEWRRARKQRLADGRPVRPGIDALLRRAARAGTPVGVVSSSPLSWVGGHLTRLGLRDRMAFLVTGEVTPRHKPAPDLYLAALARASVPAGRALALEDSPTGVAAACAAGVRCVAVRGGGPSAIDRARFAGADVILDSLESGELDRWFA